METKHTPLRKNASAPAPAKGGVESDHDSAVFQQAAGNLAAQRLLALNVQRAGAEKRPVGSS